MTSNQPGRLQSGSAGFHFCCIPSGWQPRLPQMLSQVVRMFLLPRSNDFAWQLQVDASLPFFWCSKMHRSIVSLMYRANVMLLSQQALLVFYRDYVLTISMIEAKTVICTKKKFSTLKATCFVLYSICRPRILYVLAGNPGIPGGLCQKTLNFLEWMLSVYLNLTRLNVILHLYCYQFMSRYE